MGSTVSTSDELPQGGLLQECRVAHKALHGEPMCGAMCEFACLDKLRADSIVSTMELQQGGPFRSCEDCDVGTEALTSEFGSFVDDFPQTCEFVDVEEEAGGTSGSSIHRRVRFAETADGELSVCIIEVPDIAALAMRQAIREARAIESEQSDLSSCLCLSTLAHHLFG